MPGTVSVGDLSIGMPVAGSDGEEIGVINHVVENPGAPENSPASFYFQVDVGGLLGLGSKHLYVPVDAVERVIGGESVSLSCTAEQAKEQFKQEPQP
jgi:hypothetical protein